jgi:hypothetical protein
MDSMLEGLDAALAANEEWSEAAREDESAVETMLLARARQLV